MILATITNRPRIVLHPLMIKKMIECGYERTAIFEALRYRRNSSTAEEIRERAMKEFNGVRIIEPSVEWSR